MTRSLLVVLCCTLSTVAGANPGQQVRVPEDFKTLQAAIDAVTPGATIVVAPGDYEGPVHFNEKGVTIRSAKGPAATTLRAPARLKGKSPEDSNVWIGPGGELSGFTITGSTGVALWTRGDRSVIRGNVFLSNDIAINGNASSPVIERNVFRLNYHPGDVAGVISISNGSPVIRNNLFADNPARCVVCLPPLGGTTPVVANNTFVRNGIAVENGRVTRNNVFVDNRIALLNTPASEYNLLWHNRQDYVDGDDKDVPPGAREGDVTQDPGFVDPQKDYRLKPTSGAIDAGSPLGAPSDDLEGNPRPVDGDARDGPEVDMGAYEFAAPDSRPVPTQPVQWRKEDGGNGHYYEILRPDAGVSWAGARAAARARKHAGLRGHLATLTSAAERDFVRDNCPLRRAWIGLYVPPAADGAAFRWVTGEPTSFAAWKQSAAPADRAQGGFAYVAADGAWRATSNIPALDGHPHAPMGYLVEYSDAESDQPAVAAQTAPPPRTPDDAAEPSPPAAAGHEPSFQARPAQAAPPKMFLNGPFAAVAILAVVVAIVALAYRAKARQAELRAAVAAAAANMTATGEPTSFAAVHCEHCGRTLPPDRLPRDGRPIHCPTCGSTVTIHTV